MDLQSFPLEELKQIHDYVRHILEVYVMWFTFFLVLLLGAMGWSVKASFDNEGRFRYPLPYLSMMLLFGLQLGLSIAATDYIRDDLREFDARAHALISLANQSAAIGLAVPSSIHRAMQLMQYTLMSNLVFWLLLGVVLWLTRRKRVTNPANHNG